MVSGFSNINNNINLTNNNLISSVSSLNNNINSVYSTSQIINLLLLKNNQSDMVSGFSFINSNLINYQPKLNNYTNEGGINILNGNNIKNISVPYYNTSFDINIGTTYQNSNGIKLLMTEQILFLILIHKKFRNPLILIIS